MKVNIVKNCVEYKYSSYKEYVNKKEIIDADSIKLAFGDSNYMPTFRWIHKEDEYFSDIEVDNSKRIEKYIMNYEKDKDICIEQVKQNKEKMKELLEYVRNKNWGKKITNKEIAKALQMNERTLRRRIQS